MQKQRIIYCYLYLFFHVAQANCQTLSLRYGPVFLKSKAISPIAEAKEDFSNNDFDFAISYEHCLKQKRYSIIGAYTTFRGFNYINFKEGGYKDNNGGVISALGWNGTTIHRVDVLYAYKISLFRRFNLKPFAGIGLQFSLKNGSGLLDVPINGPDYVETEAMIAEAFNTFQPIPTAGFTTGFSFTKWEFGLGVQGFYGYIPIQKSTLKYKYKGIVQTDAIYGTDGTGYYTYLSIGYKLGKKMSKK